MRPLAVLLGLVNFNHSNGLTPTGIIILVGIPLAAVVIWACFKTWRDRRGE